MGQPTAAVGGTAAAALHGGGPQLPDPRGVGILVVGKEVETAHVRPHPEHEPVQVTGRVAGAAQDVVTGALAHRLHSRRLVAPLRLLTGPAEEVTALLQPEEEVLDGSCGAGQDREGGKHVMSEFVWCNCALCI